MGLLTWKQEGRGNTNCVRWGCGVDVGSTVDDGREVGWNHARVKIKRGDKMDIK